MATTEHAQAAALVRKELKANGIKAAVRSSSASMTSSVRVVLTDEPPAVVKAVTLGTDRYAYERGAQAHPQARFVFVDVEFSAELRQAAIEWVAAEYNSLEGYDLEAYAGRVLRGMERFDSAAFWSAHKPRQRVAA